ncbi:hypothetical protein Taro_048447 [Colocasia esculenta]|uniref:Uncharacterized protein n=1 Tax=Colocasia esculenta TaxID=4460 RepID=A0A843WY75_COLES|nr:hypothetical protein [Colocasia esculenta]
MASHPPPPPAGAAGIHFAEAGAAVASYSARLWKAILAVLPSSDSSLLGGILRLSPWGSSSRRRRRRRRRLGIPLPLRSNAVESSLVATGASRLLGVLDDILDHIFSSLHNIQKNLQFWESRAEATYGQKLYFMVFERGPKAFIEETVHLVSRWGAEGSSMQHLHHSATITIFERISVLTSLQNCLASFLAQVYTEIDKYGEGLTKDFEKSLPLLLVNINGLFTELEESISHTKEIYKVSKCQKPHRMSLHWIRYTCGAVGLSICTMWLVRHSRLMGSSDIDNWVREAKESTIGFWKSHVEQPLFSIRDELFETFRRRHKGVIEYEEVQLTSNSLHRMLLAFCEQTTGRKFPENTSDQEMLEIVMSR